MKESDTHFRERAARQRRQVVIVAAVVAAFACTYFGITGVLRDDCTGSFDRAPRSVVTTFVNTIAHGDGDRMRRCWEHNVYYDLDAGCSEICLSRMLGTSYRVLDISLTGPYVTEQGRANIVATIRVTCPDRDQQHSGEILLDGIASNVPWRHWKIIKSTFGGSLGSQWCQ
jgi:hypothetical protein